MIKKSVILLILLSAFSKAEQVQITSPIPLPVNLPNFAIQLDPAGRSDDQPVYIGFATAGTAKSASGWRILELIYDASSNISQVLYASGTASYDKIWNNRTIYAYN